MTDTPFPADGLPLLATKLFVPRPRPDLVPRPRLLARLDEGLDRASCTLLSAPAGAGKTSLLAAWAEGIDRPTAWLTLDGRDQDPHRFLRYLIAAVTTVAPAAARISWLDGPPPPVEAVLTGLVNAATEATPAVLVLDDHHEVHAPAVHDAVGFLVDHLPPNMHLVVAGREDPPLPLPRLRAAGRLVELRAAELGFTVPEATTFLRAGMGLPLTGEQVAALVERTEGWAAGLQLAGLALRGRPDPGAFVSAFTGGHRLIADYLSAEVLARQSPRTRAFLAATAGLDRFCAPLCDAVLDDDVGDGRAILEELDRANLFLVPLDDDRTWYRYHHLFADALRARLARETHPDGLTALHRRASTWFGAHGLVPEAIQHALAAGALDDAAAWLEALTPVMLGSPDVHRPMEDWLAALPDEVVRARPMLGLAHAYLLINRLQIARAAAWTDAAARAISDDGDDARRVRGAVAAMRALLSTLGPAASPENAAALAGRALDDLPAQDVPFRGIAAVASGQAALARGRPDQAEGILALAVDEGRDAGLVHGTLLVAAHQVGVQRLQGTRLRALATGRAALAWGAARGSASTPGHATVSVLVADLLADGNDPADAVAMMVEAHRALARHPDRPQLLLLGSLALARLRLFHGDTTGAEAALADARPLLERGPYAALAPMLSAADALVRFARGEGSDAVAWAVSQHGALRTAFRLQTHILAAAVDTLLLAPAQILVGHGRATEDAALLQQAADLLAVAGEQARLGGLGWLGLRVAILRAAVAHGLGDPDTARASLAAAVMQAEPECVVRPFVEAGPSVRPLLGDLRSSTVEPSTAAFLDVLLGALSRPSVPAAAQPGLVDPLTARELDVLRLLAAGRSNAGMAHVLTVEQSTVKTHLIHLYEKLGVHSRTEAVARARALRLLD